MSVVLCLPLFNLLDLNHYLFVSLLVYLLLLWVLIFCDQSARLPPKHTLQTGLCVLTSTIT